MKNVDLKKRYEEGKTACKIFHRFYLITLFAFLLFSNALAQIPINGFCKFQSYNTQRQFSKIFPINYNQDNLTDLLLFSTEGKKFIAHKGDEEKIIADALQKFSYFSIDDLILLQRNDIGNDFYVFVSRKERIAGLVSFTKYGTMQILNQIKFDSYPSRIDVGDIDGDGKNEALVSGMNFNGLSILREDNYILRETKVVTGKVFKDAKLIDLEYDSFADIAAFDLLTNSIVFYYNSELYEFNEYRSINVGEEIEELKITDYNNDSYEDLMYHHKEGIEILLGDSVSTFKEKVYLKTKIVPDEYAVSDFNKDGYKDIAYINKEAGDLFISFAKSPNRFYDPIHYLHNAGLVDITGFNNGVNDYLAILNNSGQLNLISRFSVPEDEMYISIGGKPGAITSFKSFLPDTRDLCFVDSYNNSLNLLINDRHKMFSKYYQFRLSDLPTNIIVEDKGKAVRTFYLFSYGQKFIETVNIDFETDEIHNDCLYTYSPIIDLRLDKLSDDNSPSLYVLVKQDSSLSMINYKYLDYKYVTSTSRRLKSGTIDAGLAFEDSPLIYYWNFSKGLFKKGILETGGPSESDTSIITIDNRQNKVVDIFINTFDFLDKGRTLPVSVVNDEQSASLYYYNGAGISKGKFKGILRPISDKNQIQLFSTSIMRESFLYLYDSGNETLYQAQVPKGNGTLTFYKLFESMFSNSYFVNNLFLGKTYLVFTERTTNNIKLQRIE